MCACVRVRVRVRVCVCFILLIATTEIVWRYTLLLTVNEAKQMYIILKCLSVSLTHRITTACHSKSIGMYIHDIICTYQEITPISSALSCKL